MGEARKDALRLYFDRRLKLEFHGIKVTRDADLWQSGGLCLQWLPITETPPASDMKYNNL